MHQDKKKYKKDPKITVLSITDFPNEKAHPFKGGMIVRIHKIYNYSGISIPNCCSNCVKLIHLNYE